MKLATLEAFVAVTHEGSFTKASIALALTQPTVSARIASLEADLGVELFDRRGRPLTLTAEGQRLLPIAYEILGLIESAPERVNRGTSTESLRIGTNTVADLTITPRALERFHNVEPNVALRIEVERSVNLNAMLSNNEIDVALMNADLAHYLSEDVWNHSMDTGLYAPESSPWAVSDLTVPDLVEMPFIAFTVGPAWRDMRRLQVLTGHGLRIVAQSNSARSIAQLVAEGVGCAILPTPVAGSSKVAGICRASLRGYESEPWSVSLVKWTGRDLTDVAVRFVRTLEEVAHSSL